MKIGSGPSPLRRVGVLMAIALVAALAAAPAAQGFVYWTNSSTGTIGRANLDGSGVDQSFITLAKTPFGVAVDGAHVYWGNADSVNTIGRANLDGTNPSFIANADGPFGVAVDSAHIYWANIGGTTATIGRANLDGSGADQSFITLGSAARGVAVDGTHIYWDDGADNAIGRANLNGSGVDPSFISGLNGPVAVAVDRAHVYWVNGGTSSIGRANLDGSGVDQRFIPGASSLGVAVDGAHIYWTNFDAGTIGRATLDGSVVNPKFITGATKPVGIAVDALPLATGGPGVTDLRISPSIFPAANSGGSIAQAARRTGARVSYRDSQPALTTFTVLRATPGIRRGTSCVRPRSGITGGRCTRYVRVGSFRHTDRAGTDRFQFTGRVRRHKLSPGRYRLKAVPRFAGRNGPATTRSFRIIL